ncbi:LysR family transcriptional regulator [Acinetobacter puyangensis]|uniref:Transcriptional regulator, LysR family n=1 Tax=Acinetobacter puyangensis TaxID=1096779 RepID=A0A240EDV8_9GAMM|nr:LysR family transcriptional regulator [Acinetobacter puyangensis]SNX46874.1 transcriptional regulator, LysR family [Acinetobacter puyangensis]
MSAYDKVSDLEFFLKIVEAGSLTRAAILMESSLPSMSRRLSQLEQRLGVKLIDRNARRFKLTEKGQYFLEQTQQIVLLIENMENNLQSEQDFLTGKLRIGSLNQFGKQHLAGWIAEFSEQYPYLKIELLLSDSRVDLMEQELDFSFQIEVPLEADYFSLLIIRGQKIYCASPEYFQKFGKPENPHHLTDHQCLCLIRNRHTFNDWPFMDSGKNIVIKVTPHLISNSSEIIRKWALDGMGIAYKLNWDIREDLASGTLIECLDKFNPMHKNLYMVYLRNNYTQPKFRYFIDFIMKKIKP